MVTNVDGRVVASTQLVKLQKPYENIADIGLTMDEAKLVLGRLQARVVQEQAAAYVRMHSRCPHCRHPLGIKDQRTIRYRTLFGDLALRGDRYRSCRCSPCAQKTITPLVRLLPERTAPQMLFLAAKLAALASYGLSAKLLKEFLGIDGGYLKNWHNRTGKFEVIVGKSVAANETAMCFAGVHRYDPDPRGRLARVLVSQGYQPGASVRFHLRWREGGSATAEAVGAPGYPRARLVPYRHEIHGSQAIRPRSRSHRERRQFLQRQ